MALINDISDLLRISLCFLASIVVLIGGYLTYRLNGLYDSSLSQDFLQFLLYNETLPLIGIIIGLSIPFFLIAGTHVINDYFDHSNDVLNQRFDRPLARGTVKLKTARNLFISLYSLAIVAAVVVVVLYGVTPLLIPTVIIFVGFGTGYNLGIKQYGILGNIWVSIGYVAPILMGALLLGMINSWVVLNIVIICLFVLFLALGREILKDIMDIEGDLATGKRSIAITLGANWAARISGLVYVISITCGILLITLGFRNNWVYIAGFAILVVLILVTTTMLIRNPTKENAIRGRKYTRWSLWWSTLLIFISSFFLY